MSGLTSLCLNIKNNNLTFNVGEPIGEIIFNLKSLIDVQLDLSDNRLGPMGV